MHETNAEFEPHEGEMIINIWAFGSIFVVLGVIAILYYLRYVVSFNFEMDFLIIQYVKFLKAYQSLITFSLRFFDTQQSFDSRHHKRTALNTTRYSLLPNDAK